VFVCVGVLVFVGVTVGVGTINPQITVSTFWHPIESINVILTDGAETNCGGNVNVMGTVVPLPTYEHWFP
jgi:hypothetical protein